MSRYVRLIAALAILLPMAGCGFSSVTTVVNTVGAKQATEDRPMVAEHVVGSAVEVSSPFGSVEILADPSLKEVSILAKVIANGDTDEEAKARLADIKFKVERRGDKVLEIGVEPPKPGEKLYGGCSFVVRIPDATGIKAKTANGAITVKGLAGRVVCKSSFGAVTVADITGDVDAHTSNGAVRVDKASGNVTAESSFGRITINNAGAAVKAKTSNGAIELTDCGGEVSARSSFGSVTIVNVNGDVLAESSNGAIKVTDVERAAKIDSSFGTLTVERVHGKVAAKTSNGSIHFVGDPGSIEPFDLNSSFGSIDIRLPASAKGTINAATKLGKVTVGGSRKPVSVTDEKSRSTIIVTADGPVSHIGTLNGGISVTLD